MGKITRCSICKGGLQAPDGSHVVVEMGSRRIDGSERVDGDSPSC